MICGQFQFFNKFVVIYFHNTSSVIKRCYLFPICLLEFSYFCLDVSGYVEEIGDITKSASSTNTYFNIKIRVQPETSESVRVMENQASRRQLFADKKEAHQPICLRNVNTADSGVIFFNSNSGSLLYDDNSVNFTFNPESHCSIASLLDKTRGTFTIKGRMKWLSEPKSCNTTSKGKISSPIKRTVREGLFTDKSGFLPISVWQEHIPSIDETKTMTITNVGVRFFKCKHLDVSRDSKISVLEENVSDEEPDWKMLEGQYAELLKKGSSFLSSPKVMNAIVHVYKKCNNASCNKKLTTIPGKQTARCLHCKRAMLLKDCIQSSHANVLFEHEGSTYDLTIFHDVLKAYFQGDDVMDFEEKLLLLKDVKITYNNKKVVTCTSDI